MNSDEERIELLTSHLSLLTSHRILTIQTISKIHNREEIFHQSLDLLEELIDIIEQLVFSSSSSATSSHLNNDQPTITNNQETDENENQPTSTWSELDHLISSQSNLRSYIISHLYLFFLQGGVVDMVFILIQIKTSQSTSLINLIYFNLIKTHQSFYFFSFL